MKIVEDHPSRPTAIFTDSQAAIQAMRSPKNQSGQYILRELARRITNCGNNIQLHWIPAHEGVPGNEAADVAAKEATGWRENTANNCGPQASNPDDMKILTSAVKAEIRTHAKNDFTKKWATGPSGRVTYKINKLTHKAVLKKFRLMSRPESSVIIQARTGKIGLRDYLYKINSAPSPACPCGFRRQTVHHTLLECPGFNELREEM